MRKSVENPNTNPMPFPILPGIVSQDEGGGLMPPLNSYLKQPMAGGGGLGGSSGPAHHPLTRNTIETLSLDT
jgi:hypothetical protein